VRWKLVPCLLAVSFVTGCGDKQRSYADFVACTKKVGFHAVPQEIPTRSQLGLPWLEHVADLQSPGGNYVIVMFVSADEARARARQRLKAAITTVGRQPRTVNGVESKGQRVWYWTSGPNEQEANALVSCL
jgi:hypothetical protein